MLWPLADRPRLAPGAPGGTIPVRLVDDELGHVAGRRRPAGHPAVRGRGRHQPRRRSRRRRRASAVPGRRPGPAGHRQRDDRRLRRVRLPRRPRSATGHANAPRHRSGRRDHSGSNRLRALAHRTCVAPLPYAQADLDALQRVKDRGLSAIATNSVGDIVDHILGATSTRGATLLPDGPLTGRAVDLLSANDSTVAIAAADLSAPESGSDATRRYATPHPGGCPRRWWSRRSTRPSEPRWRAPGPTPSSPPTWTLRWLSGWHMTRTPLAARTRWAPCLWHALEPDAAPRTQILVPPATWNLRAEDAQVHADRAGHHHPIGSGGAPTAAGGDRRRREPHRPSAVHGCHGVRRRRARPVQ